MMPAACWSLAFLLAIPSAGAGPECNRVCEDQLKDVFGCCPQTPTSTGRVGARRSPGVPLVTFQGPSGHPLLAMKQEVSQALYQAVTGSAPSAHGACGATCPVERVHWCDAVAFANRLSVREWLRPAYRIPAGFQPGMDVEACDRLAPEVTWDPTANGWRLPTQAEWEALAVLEDVPADLPARQARSRPACGGLEDRQGICDAVGNVWEWTWDADSEGLRGVRGCSFACAPGTAGVGSSQRCAPGVRDEGIGFRLVRAP
ncbi:MAG: SUMF1/EgtB/PvdO family nonheme iron enzyme [Deltaproteobacteria bacterium]|nr:SUMF1/EgtB/PvdO family nonheme iron enzyme [Deltaproteobacteria bacterium]